MIRTPATSTMRSRCAAGIAALVAAFTLTTGLAHAQLRIVNYNTGEGARAGMEVVLQSIGEEIRNGFAKPIDVLALQEQTNYQSTTQAILDVFDGIYGEGVYALVPFNGQTSGAGRPGLIYNTNTVQVIAQNGFGSINSTSNARQTVRYQLRPVGYNSSADFYLYNSHFKSSQGFDSGATTSNENRRLAEATTNRTHATYGSDLLAEGTHIIYTGDFNLYTAGEPAFQKLLEDGNGKAIDPLGLIDPTPDGNSSDAGDWHNNSAVAYSHTQSPTTTATYEFQVTGGMDDRFDFQLVSEEFDDGEGLSILDGSYHAFGNGGNICCNSSINVGSNAVTFPGVTSFTKSEILNALRVVTDHIPVVVDYQVPAIMQAVLGTVPSTLNVGDIFNVDVTVSNIANVVAAIGADELDYSVTTAFGGAVSGSYFEQVAMALSAGNVHSLLLDTSTAGIKTGTIMVQSPSHGVQNASYEFPISYEVLAAGLDGDYNNDGLVDAADYTLWRNNLGGPEDSLFNRDPQNMGDIGLADYDSWKSNYGQSLSGSGGLADSSNQAVPEPAAWLLLVLGGCLCRTRVGTLRAWNRAT